MTASVAAAEGRDQRWPTFQHDQENSGFLPGARGPKRDVDVAWRERPSGTWREGGFGPVHATVPAGPAIVGETVYIGDTSAFYALDRSSDEERWSFDGAGSTKLTPAVVDGRVFVITGGSAVHVLDKYDRRGGLDGRLRAGRRDAQRADCRRRRGLLRDRVPRQAGVRSRRRRRF